jgi:hypothetical protein
VLSQTLPTLAGMAVSNLTSVKGAITVRLNYTALNLARVANRPVSDTSSPNSNLGKPLLR